MENEIIQINENTWRIEEDGHVRFFLLTGTKEALLIDSGMQTHNAREIAEGLTSLPLKLLNTHADRDHVGSNGEFSTFYMHPAEASNYYNTQKLTGDFTPIEEGDRLDLGERPLEILSLPGHTPGSIAVLDVRGRALFCGDPIQDGTIFLFGVQRELHAYRKSLKKLDRWRDRFDLLYPSHGSCPVKPELIDRLYEASGALLEGKTEQFEVSEAEFFGTRVRKYDVGAAVFLLDER